MILALDNKTRAAVPSLRLLVTGNTTAPSPVSYEGFLYPAHRKSAGLSREYTEYLELLCVAVTNSPALADPLVRRTQAMCKTPYIRLSEPEVVCEHIDDALAKLTFVRCMMLRGRTVAKLHHKEIQDVLITAEHQCHQARVKIVREVDL
jgi:hypothetical protein